MSTDEKTELGPRNTIRIGVVIAGFAVAAAFGAWMTTIKSELTNLREDLVDSSDLQAKATDSMAMQLREINASIRQLDGDKVRIDTMGYWTDLLQKQNPTLSIPPFPRK